MTTSRSFSLAAALILCTATATAQAPANDNCANAIAVAVGNTALDCTGAIIDGLELDPLVCDPGVFGDDDIYQDIWFTFTAPNSNNYSFEVLNNATQWDSRIALYDQSTCPDDPANVIACDDDSGLGLMSLLPLVSVNGGSTYLIRVGTFVATTTTLPGELIITDLGPPPPPPANDDCANAIAAGIGLTPVDTTGATTDGLALDPLVCDPGPVGDDQIYDDAWFTFTPPTTDNYDIALINNGNATFDGRLAIYSSTGCPDDPALVIACDDDAGPALEPAVSIVPMTAGVPVMIRVGAFSAATVAELSALQISISPPPPANDDCANASVAMIGQTPVDTNFTTTDGSALDPLVCDADPMDPDERIYNDQWFTFTAPATDNYTIATTNSDFDSKIAVYSVTTCPANPANVVACDDTGGFNEDIIGLNIASGSAVLIRVGSAAGNLRGFANLDISVTPPPPANDDCANAIAASVGVTAFDSTAATDGTGLELDPLVCDMGTFGDEQIYQDVWFSFTPAAAGFYDMAVINNGNTSFDNRIAVYNQSTCPDDPANVIACDDDAGPGLEAAVFGVSLGLGQTVLIRCGSFSAATVEQPAALSIVLGAGPPANDNCANAEVITMHGTYPYDTSLATTDSPDLTGFCDMGDFGSEAVHNEVWFEYTPTVGGCTYISTLNLAGHDSRIAVFNTSTCPADPATVLACSDDEVQPIAPPFEAGLDVDLNAGTTYLIAVGTFSDATMGAAASVLIGAGPVAVNNDSGMQPGAPGCVPGPTFPSSCNGDGGNQMGCTPCPCGNEATPGTIGGCLNSSGNATAIAASGDTSVSLPSGDTTDLRLTLSGAPSGAFCVMLSGGGVAPAGMANPCFGLGTGVQSPDRDGLRCAVGGGQALLRHGGRSANASGEVMDSSGPSRVWGGEAQPAAGLAGQAGFVAGQTRHFQVTHREDALAVCMRGLNTSQALEVTFTP